MKGIALMTSQPFMSLQSSPGTMFEFGEPVIHENVWRRNEKLQKSTSGADCSTIESSDPFLHTITQNSYIEMVENSHIMHMHRYKKFKMLFSSKMGLSFITAGSGITPWTFTRPAQSPDVTPLDFFFWGYVKD